MQHILVVEADDHTLTARCDELLLDAYEPLTATTRQHARTQLTGQDIDALILGSLQTPADSLALLRSLRGGELPGANPRLPVITIGADSDPAAVRHYQAGADLALPSTASALLIKHGLEALAARVAGQRERRKLIVGKLTVDRDARVATINQTPVKLTRLEFDLLETLASQPRRVFTRAELTRDVWGYDPAAAGISRSVDTAANRLRHNLTAAGADPLVHAVWGVGYRLSR